MSDRIAVLSKGRVEQVGPPRLIYEEPATVFVADFLGVSNLMTVTAHGLDERGRCRIRLGDFELRAAHGKTNLRGDTRVTIRPERVRLEPSHATGENRLPGTIERLVYLGNAVQLIVRLATGHSIQALIQNTGDEISHREGAALQVHLPVDALRVLADTGQPEPPKNGAEETASPTDSK